MKKAIIFDFDGTLGDTKACVVKATQSAFDKCGYEKPESEVIEHYMGIPIEVFFPKMISKTLSEDELGELLHVFRQEMKTYEVDEIRLFDGVKQMLRELNRQRIRCFVLSSKKTESLIRNTDNLNITTYFKDIIGSDRVTAYKPDPAGILAILDMENLSPKEVIMVGDATYDIIMANTAGVESVAVLWGSHSRVELEEENPTYIVSSTTELLNYLIR